MRFLLSLAAALMLAPFAALAAEDAAKTGAADEAAEHAKRWAACTAEIAKFCATVEPGKGQTRKCLEPHVAELSGGCKARLAEKHEHGERKAN